MTTQGPARLGEQVALSTRPHGGVLLLPLLVLLVVLALVGFGAAALPEAAWQSPARWVGAAAAALVVLRCSVLPWLRWLGTRLTVTDRQVVLRSGVLRSSSRSIPLSRIADVGVSRSLLQRLVGSGTLVLETVGERGRVAVADVPGAPRVAERLADLLDDVPLLEPDDAGDRRAGPAR